MVVGGIDNWTKVSGIGIDYGLCSPLVFSPRKVTTIEYTGYLVLDADDYSKRRILFLLTGILNIQVEASLSP